MYRGPIRPNLAPSEDEIREIFLKPDKNYLNGWNDAIEAAAEELDGLAEDLFTRAEQIEISSVRNAMKDQMVAYKLGAAAIRKLKKP